MGERAYEHDWLAVVGHGIEDGEVAIGDAPANVRDLSVELCGRGIARWRRVVLVD